jgi:hypothetical protein
VRIWLLNSGPSRPLAFHVVGGQFHTTYAEGRWRLGDRTQADGDDADDRGLRRPGRCGR